MTMKFPTLLLALLCCYLLTVDATRTLPSKTVTTRRSQTVRPYLDHLNPRQELESILDLRAGDNEDSMNVEVIEEEEETSSGDEMALVDLSEYMETALDYTQKLMVLLGKGGRIAGTCLYQWSKAYYRACKRAYIAGTTEDDELVPVEDDSKLAFYSKKALRCLKRSTIAFWTVPEDEKIEYDWSAFMKDNSNTAESSEEEQEEVTPKKRRKTKKAKVEPKPEPQTAAPTKPKTTQVKSETPQQKSEAKLGKVAEVPSTKTVVPKTASRGLTRFGPVKKVLVAAVTVAALSFLGQDMLLPKLAVLSTSLRKSRSESSTQGVLEEVVQAEKATPSSANEEEPPSPPRRGRLPWQK